MTHTVFFAKRSRSAAYRTVSVSQGRIIRREIWGSSFCFLGCALLVPSSVLLGHAGLAAIVGLITASLCLTVAATITAFFATSSKEISCPNKARRTFTSKLYFLSGAVFFLVASTMYLPFWSSQSIGGTTIAELGTWVFRFGSLAYLVCPAKIIFQQRIFSPIKITGIFGGFKPVEI